MTTHTQIETPRLAAFGAPIWAYKPVTVLGVEVAAAVFMAVVGVLLIAVPVAVAFVVGGDLSEFQNARNSMVVPTSLTVQAPTPPMLEVGYSSMP